MSKSYTASYSGKAYNKTIIGWHEFLADKLVFEHISYGNMVKKLKNRDENGLTIRQCLGIDEYDRRHPGMKKESPAVSRTDMPKFILVNSLLNKFARSSLCQN